MGPYLSRTLIRVHRVIRQGSSGPIGSRRDISATSAKVPVRSKNIKFDPKWVENQPFGSKQRPNEPNRLSGPIRTTSEAKNDQKSDFLRKTAPREAAPLTPIGAGRDLHTVPKNSCEIKLPSYDASSKVPPISAICLCRTPTSPDKTQRPI